MRILTREQARSLDTLAMNVHGISGETLMGNAGDKIATRVQSTLEGIHLPKIGIICGKGNVWETTSQFYILLHYPKYCQNLI